jgi:hypothetical protein
VLDARVSAHDQKLRDIEQQIASKTAELGRRSHGADSTQLVADLQRLHTEVADLSSNAFSAHASVLDRVSQQDSLLTQMRGQLAQLQLAQQQQQPQQQQSSAYQAPRVTHHTAADQDVSTIMLRAEQSKAERWATQGPLTAPFLQNDAPTLAGLQLLPTYSFPREPPPLFVRALRLVAAEAALQHSPETRVKRLGDHHLRKGHTLSDAEAEEVRAATALAQTGEPASLVEYVALATASIVVGSRTELARLRADLRLARALPWWLTKQEANQYMTGDLPTEQRIAGTSFVVTRKKDAQPGTTTCGNCGKEGHKKKDCKSACSECKHKAGGHEKSCKHF